MYSEHENAYDILGISRNATSVDLKKAYTSLIRLAHPDKGGNSEDFQRIQSAYDSLKEIIGRKRTAPVDHAASAASTFLFRGKRMNLLGGTCFSRDAPLRKRPWEDANGRIKHGSQGIGIKEDVYHSTPASMQAELKAKVKVVKPPAASTGSTSIPFPLKRVAAPVKQSPPNSAEPAKEKLLTDEELHSLRNQISQAEGREARLKLLQHLPKCQAQQLGEFMQQFPIPPQAEAPKEKLLTDEELHSLRNQISQAEGREARMKLLQHLPKCQAEQLREFMQQFTSPPQAEPPKKKLLTDEELHSLRNQVSQVEGREERLKLLQHLPKCQAQQLHWFMRQFGRPDIPDVSSGVHAAPQSEPKPEESHAKPEPQREPQVRCTDGTGPSDDDDSHHHRPSSDVPPETGGPEAGGERENSRAPDIMVNDDNMAALFTDIPDDTLSSQARYFEEASEKRIQERRSMGGSEERELCWGFSHKRQKWHQVYVYPSAWEGADEKINVAYSQDTGSREYSMHRHSITRTEPEELKAAKGRGGLEHQLFLQKSLFQAVKIGKKKWEGRINDLKAKQIKVGDFIIFNKILRREVFDRRTYKTFKEMLSDIGAHEILPGCTDMETAIGIFQNFPNNRLNCKNGKTNEETYGCVAFQLSEIPLMTRSIPSSSSSSTPSSIPPAHLPPRTPLPEEKINGPPPVSRSTMCGPSFQKPRIEVGIRDESEEERDLNNNTCINGNNCNDHDDSDDNKPIECGARRARIGARIDAGHDLDLKSVTKQASTSKRNDLDDSDDNKPIEMRKMCAKDAGPDLDLKSVTKQASTKKRFKNNDGSHSTHDHDDSDDNKPLEMRKISAKDAVDLDLKSVTNSSSSSMKKRFKSNDGSHSTRSPKEEDEEEEDDDDGIIVLDSDSDVPLIKPSNDDAPLSIC